MMKHTFVLPLTIITTLCTLLLFLSCGKEAPKEIIEVTARLSAEQNQLFLVLHNNSAKQLVFCKRNFYLPREFMDIRNCQDTTAFSAEQIFGKKPVVIKRKTITVSDYVPVAPGGELALPVDLRSVQKGCRLGDTVLIAIRFMNIDPFACSRLEVEKYGEKIRDYCELLHYVPNAELSYWSGEVKTAYAAFSFCRK